MLVFTTKINIYKLAFRCFKTLNSYSFINGSLLISLPFFFLFFRSKGKEPLTMLYSYNTRDISKIQTNATNKITIKKISLLDCFGCFSFSLKDLECSIFTQESLQIDVSSTPWNLLHKVYIHDLYLPIDQLFVVLQSTACRSIDYYFYSNRLILL